MTSVLTLCAVGAYVLIAVLPSHCGRKAMQFLLGAAWALHAACLFQSLLGADIRFGFAPALSVTAWLALTVYAVESRLYPHLRVRRVFAVLGGMAVLAGALFPGALLHVSASPWLPVHLALGIASYGLFGAAVVHAALMTRAEAQIRKGRMDAGVGIPLLTLERLTFRFVFAGFILLCATLLGGWLFSETLHGAAWHWDHKTVFSCLSWLIFAVLLLGRIRFGWRGVVASRMVYAGAAMLLLSYVGSRFVLEVVLGRVV